MSDNRWGFYDAARSEQRALEGDWRAQIAVITRPIVDPAVLAAILNQPGLHEQVQLVITERRDVTVEQLEFLAQRTASAVVINRIIMTTTTPIEVIEAIRANALTLEDKIWFEVAEHAGRSWPAAGRPGADNQELRGSRRKARRVRAFLFPLAKRDRAPAWLFVAGSF
ncbi:hypothetical protein [Crystallibacter degradans]|uniref:hypothetical protein n=1 Tax=Crystallibacter degradans TaxID=2726743 RepID=UPI00147540D3|nr:hypothetical protein [Arthrobacter sp. SF27]NMR32066.1 hypothetical protein [Arthrobacter sp. SF27]